MTGALVNSVDIDKMLRKSCQYVHLIAIMRFRNQITAALYNEYYAIPTCYKQ